MLNVFVVLFAAFGRWFRRHLTLFVVCLASLLSACSMVGGVSTLPALVIPKDQVREVCWQPTNENLVNPAAEITDGVEDEGDGAYFALEDDKGPVISSKQRNAFARAIMSGGFIYKYVWSAPIESLRLVPFMGVEQANEPFSHLTPPTPLSNSALRCNATWRGGSRKRAARFVWLPLL